MTRETYCGNLLWQSSLPLSAPEDETEVETGNRELGTEKNPSPEPRAPQIVTFPNLKCIQGKGTIEE